MIQDIFPHRLDISFALPEQQTDDFVLCFQGRKIALREDGSYPRRRELPPLAESQYLFSIDGEHYFLGRCEQEELPGKLSWQSTRRLRGMKPMEQALAGFTAQHLWTWYESNRFCGKCGHPMELGQDERKVCCPHCGNAVYPRINPAVIAAVTDGDRLLMTRYADRPVTWFVLVAGFVEIGEAAEETVRREVLEETGLRVKNVRYFGSQPWGCAGNLTLGYWAELDGDDAVTLEERELAEARWFDRTEVPVMDDNTSLTSAMVRAFAEGKEREYHGG